MVESKDKEVKKTEVSGKEEKKMEKEVKETKVEEKKVESKIVTKDVAVANGFSMRVSPKATKAICKVIKGKSPQAAVKRLEAVVEGRRAIPMAGLEVAHQKGKGVAGAKFPKNACKAIIEVIKQVEANAVVNGIENPVITIASMNRASRPYRRAGRQAKRTHLHLEVKDKTKLVLKKKK